MLIRILYTILLVLIAPFLLYSLYKRKEGKPNVGSRWKEHFGITPPLSAKTQPIWIHAVSVGESIAITPLIKSLKESNPQKNIVITTTTPTGAEQISKLGDLVEHRYMPIDFSLAVRIFLKTINPSQLLIMETELWPNTLHTVAKADIPITVMNARLSERSCQRYAKVQPVFDLLSSDLSHILCQHRDDAERFIRLGINKEKITITGSIKFDITVNNSTVRQGSMLRKTLGVNRPIWIAASTHQGEDEKVIAAHKKLLEQSKDALLILVPRHPERFSSVAELCRSSDLKIVTRTSQEEVTAETQVYLGDTMGEMMTLISASDTCFMGGSLIGDKVGGHNLLEPAALSKATITGPSYFNFSDITEQLIKANATYLAHNQDELAVHIIDILSSSQTAKTMGNNALKVVNRNKGALRKTLDHIKSLDRSYQ